MFERRSLSIWLWVGWALVYGVHDSRRRAASNIHNAEVAPGRACRGSSRAQRCKYGYIHLALLSYRALMQAGGVGIGIKTLFRSLSVSVWPQQNAAAGRLPDPRSSSRLGPNRVCGQYPGADRLDFTTTAWNEAPGVKAQSRRTCRSAVMRSHSKLLCSAAPLDQCCPTLHGGCSTCTFSWSEQLHARSARCT